MYNKQQLVQLDHEHLWHPFTPMRQWCQQQPLIIDRGEGEFLIDIDGNRYIDGVSSLWCNVHGHRCPQIDQAIRQQLDKIAHSTLLGLASTPSIELAAMLARMTPPGLNKIFYSDAGATAVEIALKMAVGYWYHNDRPQKNNFVAFRGAYHGDTTGAMSVGFSQIFHQPFSTMIFPVHWVAAPDAVRGSLASQHKHQLGGSWPSENSQCLDHMLCLEALDKLLGRHHDCIAAIIIEPIMQGAAGMMCQPVEFLPAVKQLAEKYQVLLIADEVATGFGRTGRMFACDHADVCPDIMCLAKGLSAGYMPLAATVTTDHIEQAFTGSLQQRRTLYHGHTYTGNALACAAAVASIQLFESANLIQHINQCSQVLAKELDPLRDCPHVIDVRQRGIMVGIELCSSRDNAMSFEYTAQTGHAICNAMRHKGLIIRPLGDVLVLMPIPAMRIEVLEEMTHILVDTILNWPFT